MVLGNELMVLENELMECFKKKSELVGFGFCYGSEPKPVFEKKTSFSKLFSRKL